MARTTSNMVPLGTKAPEFSLPDTILPRNIELQEVKGIKGTVVMFICNHCPFVKHVSSQLSALARDYQEKGFSFLAISSNDANAYPEDGPRQMSAAAREWKFSFPYLYDESQAIARAFNAACTPDFFVYDPELKLVYRGQLDDSRPGNDIPVTGADIRAVLESMQQGKPVPTEQRPSIGCNIKWKE